MIVRPNELILKNLGGEIAVHYKLGMGGCH
jgi:hypothetical protein